MLVTAYCIYYSAVRSQLIMCINISRGGVSVDYILLHLSYSLYSLLQLSFCSKSKVIMRINSSRGRGVC